MILLSTPGFQTPTDIANRALDHCGADHHIDDLLTDISKNQRLILGVYTKLRQAELRRNNWRHSIKHAIIRPISDTSMQWAPPVWDAAVTYRIGQVVLYDDGFGSRLWINVTPTNLAHPPGTGIYWDNYFGQVVIDKFDTAETYYAGDLVYVADGAGAFLIYMSIMQGASDAPGTTQAYATTTTYWKDQIVVFNSQNYISKVDSNLGHQPDTSGAQWATTALAGSRQWVTLGGTLTQLAIMYPVGSGPTIQSSTRNVYPLPYGYLRKAPQDPKAGLHSILGAPTNRPADDWLLEGNYLITRDGNPINFRFVADVSVVAMFDPMFAEGLGGRIAYELCEPITQSTEKLKGIGATYEKFMREARLVNGIEGDAEEPAEDDWITTRI